MDFDIEIKLKMLVVFLFIIKLNAWCNILRDVQSYVFLCNI